ncbi:hypothetical protein DFP72DRAFT_1077886 [Ephemerocybe angulata]|uniref:Uncharacterized protein n=1 Tax=Ephemerocybe angulata TaxID=980116 RepID=A0A8H6HEK8_9AGAR|nr:hypothetical protein DFP72DRAFT_1077886 [Tulosesus angulatus]
MSLEVDVFCDQALALHLTTFHPGQKLGTLSLMAYPVRDDGELVHPSHLLEHTRTHNFCLPLCFHSVAVSIDCIEYVGFKEYRLVCPHIIKCRFEVNLTRLLRNNNLWTACTPRRSVDDAGSTLSSAAQQLNISQRNPQGTNDNDSITSASSDYSMVSSSEMSFEVLDSVTWTPTLFRTHKPPSSTLLGRHLPKLLNRRTQKRAHDTSDDDIQMVKFPLRPVPNEYANLSNSRRQSFAVVLT